MPSKKYHYRVCGSIQGETPRCSGESSFTTTTQVANTIRSIKGFDGTWCRRGNPGEDYIECDQGTDHTVVPSSGDPARTSRDASIGSAKALPGGGGYVVTGQYFTGTTGPFTIALVSTNPDNLRYPGSPSDPSGRIYHIAGNGSNSSADCTQLPHSCEDGIDARDATLLWPQDAAALPNGGVLIAENFAPRIRYIAPPNSSGVRIITTLAGRVGQRCNLSGNTTPKPLSQGVCPGEGGPGPQATIPQGPKSVEPYSYDPATGKFGFYFTADNQVWKVSHALPGQGILTRVAGDGRLSAPDGSSFSGDAGQSLTGTPVSINSAEYAHPYPTALGGGFVFFEENSCRFRHVDSNGFMTTLAGAGSNHGGKACWLDLDDKVGDDAASGALASGDGGNAREARLVSEFFDVTSDGGIVFTDFVTQPNAGQVRYITPAVNGARKISAVAGYGEIGFDWPYSDLDAGWQATYAKTAIGAALTLFQWNGKPGFFFSDNGRFRFVDVNPAQANMSPYQATCTAPGACP